jgi:hypothetical protein
MERHSGNETEGQDLRAMWPAADTSPSPARILSGSPISWDDPLGNIWPFRALFSHLSYCETAVKINAVPVVQGHTEITCSWPNEKQTEGPSEVTPSLVVYVFVFCRLEWGRRAEWCCWFLWLLCVSSKVRFISKLTWLDWSQETPCSCPVCIWRMGIDQDILPPWNFSFSPSR